MIKFTIEIEEVAEGVLDIAVQSTKPGTKNENFLAMSIVASINLLKDRNPEFIEVVSKEIECIRNASEEEPEL